MPELETNQESIQIPANQSATDFLKEQVAKTESRQEESAESASEEEDSTTETSEGESGEESTTESESGKSAEEKKATTETESDIFDESDVLKNFKFSETTFEELRNNYVNAQNRNKLLNFGVKNIPGFLDYIKDNFERSQKGMEIKPVSELGKSKTEEPDKNLAALEAISLTKPETGEPMTLAEKQSYIGRLQKVLEIAGFARKDDISTAFTEEQKNNAQKEAVKDFRTVTKTFGESIADDLKALGKNWINKDDVDELGNPKSGVSFELMDIIENELGITDPSRVNQKLLDRVWKTYLLESSGGLEMIKTNAKKSAEADHRRKIKIRMPGKTTTEKPKGEGNMLEWAKKPETTPTMIRDALKDIKGKVRR